ncbi:MAG: hydroxymethylbilane synthase [Deltaproteobacteria bacterium]|nr:hydroxymethylbilane synthase [Deltaproteobacteria bacterium]
MQQSDYSPVNRPLQIASRGSRLALWQAEYVRTLLEEAGYSGRIVEVKTTGDRVQNRFLHEIGGKGVFIREIEDILLRGEADLAVHSLKDLPVETPEPFCLSAVLPRHAAGDVLVLHPERKGMFGKGAEVGPEDILSRKGMKIATGSLRRACLLREASDDVVVFPLRGNVDTRIRKLRESSWDGLILAAASLERLTELAADLDVHLLRPDWFVPSPSQGALVLETTKNHQLRGFFESLCCEKTHREVRFERQLLRMLGGDCTMPVGIHMKECDGAAVGVSAVVLNGKGESARASIRLSQTESEDSAALGRRVLRLLREDGLDSVLAEKSPVFSQSFQGRGGQE